MVCFVGFLLGFFCFFLNNIYIGEDKLKKHAKAGEVSGGIQFISESQTV